MSDIIVRVVEICYPKIHPNLLEAACIAEVKKAVEEDPKSYSGFDFVWFIIGKYQTAQTFTDNVLLYAIPTDDQEIALQILDQTKDKHPHYDFYLYSLAVR